MSAIAEETPGTQQPHTIMSTSPKQVTELLHTEMSARGCPPDEIKQAQTLWRAYAKKADALTRRAQDYAAAAEYLMGRRGGTRRTQGELAEVYGTTQNIVSVLYREMKGDDDAPSRRRTTPRPRKANAGAAPTPALDGFLTKLMRLVEVADLSPGDDTSKYAWTLPEGSAALYREIFSGEPPGTVLDDLSVMIDALKDKAPRVSAKTRKLNLSFVRKVNAAISHPTTPPSSLKRLDMGHFPFVHGLYDLVVAVPMARYTPKGKTKLLVTLEPKMVSRWEALSAMDRYGSLLWAWLRSIFSPNEDTRNRRGFFGGLDPLFTPSHGMLTTSDRTSGLEIFVGAQNLALLQMFGLARLTTDRKADHWKVRRHELTPHGAALWAALKPHCSRRYDLLPVELQWLHDLLRRCLPGWHEALRPGAGSSPLPFRPGTWVWTASIDGCRRTIALDAECSLDDLAHAVLNAIDFDHDHLYEFKLTDPYGRQRTYRHPYLEMPPLTSDTRVGDVGLEPGGTMTFLYDLGDCWSFTTRLERITDEAPPSAPTLLASEGEAPEQYPYYD